MKTNFTQEMYNLWRKKAENQTDWYQNIDWPAFARETKKTEMKWKEKEMKKQNKVTMQFNKYHLNAVTSKLNTQKFNKKHQ